MLSDVKGNSVSIKCVGLSSDSIMNFGCANDEYDSPTIVDVRSRVTSCLGSTELEKRSKMSALFAIG